MPVLLDGDALDRGEQVGANILTFSTHNFVSNNKKLQCIGSKKGLPMASLNVNGPRNSLDEVKIPINDIRIDILALNETKLDNSFTHDSTEIAGYNQQWTDRSCFGGGFSFM